MKLQQYVVAVALGLACQTVFGALVITEVVSNPGAPAGSILDTLDWWELTNTGPSAASLDGFEWIDNPPDNGDSAIFPNGISVASGESIIILRDRGRNPTDVENAFRTDWGLSPSLQVLTESQFSGTVLFSGLGSSGDAVFLFDGPTPGFGDGSLVSSAIFGPSNPGISFEWGTNGTGLGRQSILGQHGAVSASNGRVGSPGFATAIVHSDPTIFQDTFELSSFSNPPVEPNINAELPGTRQTFATSGYTQAGGTVGGAAIEHEPFGPGSGDWLTLTATHDAGGLIGAGDSVGVANLTTDFAPSVAGKKYSVSYTSRMDIPTDPTADFWQGFGLGDDLPENLFPNNPNTDLGVLFRQNGDFSVFLDGDNVFNGLENGIDTGIRAGEEFDVEFLFDETGPSPTVTGTITATLGTVVLGTLDLDALGSGFENPGRFFELRTFVFGPDVIPGDLYINRFDNFTISEISASSLPGDFNNDGQVDAADYTVWRDNLGSLTPLDNDNGLGTPIGQDHYDLWVQHFGQTAAGSGLSASASIPEPTSLILLVVAGLAGQLLVDRRS